MPDVHQMMKRQRVLADFGELALRSEDLDEVLTEACRLVAAVLGTARAKILEIQDDGRLLFVRAGVGWASDVVGQLRMPMSELSSETFAITAGTPVISRDISKEERFVFPEFMRKADVVALANVPIRLPGGKAYGLLQVDATEPRDFGDEDTEFLRTYATILGPVIDRLRKVSTLRITEERFRLVVENARNYAIFLCDPEDRIIEWYPGAQAVFGWSAEDAVGQPAAIIYTPEDREGGVDAAETAIAAREGSAPNVRWHQRKDGSRVFIEGMTTSLRTAAGSLIGFLRIGQDVTERRHADEALRESEARHSLLIGSWAQAVWETDANGVVIADSPSWRASTGQTLQEWLGDGWLDAIHLDDRDYAERQWRDAISARGLVDAEFRLRAPGGGWRWTNVRAAPVLDEEGNIGKWVGMNIDIDARKEAEAALRESEERFRGLVEGFGQFSWEASADGFIETDSPGWRAFTGQSLDEWLERGWVQAIHPEDRELTEAKWQQAVATRTAVDHEYRLWHAPSTAWRWSNVRAVPITNADGSIRKWSGMNIDVTERHKLLARQEVLVNELQHRSRNLLGVVTSMANRTVGRGASAESFLVRLKALSRAQALLSQNGSGTVAVDALVRAELAAHADNVLDRIVIDGPAVLLNSQQVQNFALALHELTTNAVKYGALKDETGHLSVNWELIRTGGGPYLALNWVETGVDVPPEAGTRRGCGRELIEQALAYALGAQTEYVLDAGGVRCRIELPIV